MGRTWMSGKELQRVEIFSRVKAGDLTQVEAAEMVRRSYRQAQRLYRKYCEEGPAGLVHGNVGCRSNRALEDGFRGAVLKLVGGKYGGEEGAPFGPTLAAEHLEKDDGLAVKAGTLRRWMLAAGLWSRRRKRRQHRRRRERKEHFGELVQLDGSFAAWLERRGPRGCLMDMVDDATGTTGSLLAEEETTWAAADVLWLWVEAYGIPQALYTDWKNVYVREPTPKELLGGEAALTAFGKMCAKLGIEIIAASSPQAKGRVERKHGVQQDRLIKELRLKGIASREEANRFLQEEYLPEHNQRFAKPPARSGDFHRPVPQRLDLRRVFCLEEERRVSNDWVVRYHNRLLQIQRQSKVYPPAKSKVLVSEWRDGSLHILYRGQPVAWQEIEARPAEEKKPVAVQPAAGVHRKAWKPATEHPWRKAGWLWRQVWRDRRQEAAARGGRR